MGDWLYKVNNLHSLIGSILIFVLTCAGFSLTSLREILRRNSVYKF